MSVEYGQIAHAMSPFHLQRWVERKLNKKGKEAVGISFAIANKIKAQGVQPRSFIRASINETIIKYNLKIKGYDISDSPGQSRQTTSE